MHFGKQCSLIGSLAHGFMFTKILKKNNKSLNITHAIGIKLLPIPHASVAVHVIIF